MGRMSIPTSRPRTTATTRRPARTLRSPAAPVAVALLAALAACGGAGSDAGGSVTPSTSPGTNTGGTTPATDLQIVVDDGAGRTTTWQLTCDPAGGTHPDADRACRVLETAGATSLPPVPAGAMCTEIFGGPQTAHITGTWRGRAVDARLSRTNGCEIARWTGLAGLLPDGGA